MALHYTLPSTEVLLKKTVSFDIANNELPEDLGAAQAVGVEDVRVGKTVRLSVAFDVAKVDEQSAARFMNKLKEYLSDPDLMLL